MGYKHVPRPRDGYSDSSVMRLLGISRPTFYKKLREGTITGPPILEGTRRRWWTEADIELAREQMGDTGRKRGRPVSISPGTEAAA